VVLDQPGDGLGFGRGQPQARTEFARHAGAGNGVILGPALGDVVDKERHIEQPRVIEMGQQFVGKRQLVLQTAIGDFGHDADGADQVLVHRVVVVHVELHQGDDLAEIGHELAEHAALVHLAQDALHRARRGQDL
jgi:hypothetical protein